ncbi:FtsK/SpoIIIE domain-containing protein [Pseudonocardia pini]|uniref:FtsK/SpoIIIE domain-containing protein n=1 Tax=Pseudonocardia pini TaxID=2758030 RepID=UPI0015EFEA0E|nr:FtsK/SpoIIIE domain-containing protein [Pseudonocardia pini]
MTTTDKPAGASRAAKARQVAKNAARGTGRAVKAAGRHTGRHTWTAGQGVGSWARRSADAATLGHHRAHLRRAEQAGDHEATAAALALLDTAKNARKDRLLTLPREALQLLLLGVGAFAAVWVLLLAVGIGAWLLPEGLTWTSWWALVGDIFGWIGFVLKVGAISAAVAAVPWLLFVAWAEGKRAAEPPKWLMTPVEKAQVGAEITADAIAVALKHMGIAALNAAFKEGWQPEFLVPPRQQGGGTYTQVKLPLGVPAAVLLPSAKVELLGANLSRHKHETWPQRQPDEDARVLDLWVADKGALDKPAPPWPLLEEGTFDVFRDRAPWGVTMRGEPVQVGMLQKHWLVGATSNQGKTATVRQLALALALDPSVELRIADLKGDGDWSMFKERAHTLIEDNTPEGAEATCVMLESLVTEMQRRYDAKRAQNIVGPISRALSRRKGSGFHPIFAIVDECQVLYATPHPIGGAKDGARGVSAAKRLHDQSRAMNIHLIQATQRPDDRTLPARVREGVHVRAALYVPGPSTSKMILAEAADRGARPEDLRADTDAGTVVATGAIEDIPKGQAFTIVRTHYVDTASAYPVVQRAVEARKKAGYGTVAALAAPAEPDDLAAILDALRDEQRARTTVVLGRLTEEDPQRYETWKHGDLKSALERFGVTVGKSNGDRVVRRSDVEQAIKNRDAGQQQDPPASTPTAGS